MRPCAGPPPDGHLAHRRWPDNEKKQRRNGIVRARTVGQPDRSASVHLAAAQTNLIHNIKNLCPPNGPWVSATATASLSRSLAFPAGSEAFLPRADGDRDVRSARVVGRAQPSA